jgi:hypothetical protein
MLDSRPAMAFEPGGHKLPAICHRQIAPHLNNCRDDRAKRVRSAKNEKGQGTPERVCYQNEEFDPGSG